MQWPLQHALRDHHQSCFIELLFLSLNVTCAQVLEKEDTKFGYYSWNCVCVCDVDVRLLVYISIYEKPVWINGWKTTSLRYKGNRMQDNLIQPRALCVLEWEMIQLYSLIKISWPWSALWFEGSLVYIHPNNHQRCTDGWYFSFSSPIIFV